MFRRLTRSSNILLCRPQHANNSNNNTSNNPSSSSFDFQKFSSEAWKVLNKRVTLADIAQNSKYANTGKTVNIGGNSFDAKILQYPHERQQIKKPKGPIEKLTDTIVYIILILILFKILIDRVAPESRRNDDGTLLRKDIDRLDKEDDEDDD